MPLHFVTPIWLFGLLLLPLLALIHWQAVQRERDALEDFASHGALSKMDVRPGADLRLWRGLLLLAALALGLVALAQPRWGQGGTEIKAADAGSVVFVVDVSKSMRVRDLGDQSRLQASQAILEEALGELAGWRVGLVAFAGEAEAVCPLTTDHEAVRTLMARAKPGAVGGKGSDVEAGLRAAAPLFRHPGPRHVVVVSDGEALEGDAQAAVSALKEARVTAHALGVGTAEGGPVPGEPDVWGNPTYLTYRGEQVVSKLDVRALTRLADATGGSFVLASDAKAVRSLLGALGTQPGGLKAAKAALPGEDPPQPYELFQLPLALALLLVLGEAGLALVGRRRRERRFADVLKTMRRPAAVVLLLAIAQTQGAWTWYPTWLPNGEAAQAFRTGDLPRAEGLLRGAISHDPANFRLKYNLGNVLFERGNFEEAERVYGEALRGADDDARPVVRYNLGNAHFRLAEKKGDPRGYQQAITDYEAVLAVKPEDADAKHNLEVARERLKQAQKNAQKPQGGNGGGSQGKSGQNNAPTPVGVQTRYKPPPMKNLPSQGEVDSLLRALEADERQRQAEQATEPPPGQSGAGPDARNLLEQALGGLDLEKDW